MNEQQYEQLAAVCNGQYNWAEFRDRFKTYANTPENAEVFYDHLAMLLEELGVKPQNLEYKLHTEYAPDDYDAHLFLELILIDQVETVKMAEFTNLAQFKWEVNAVDQTQFNLNPRAFVLPAIGSVSLYYVRQIAHLKQTVEGVFSWNEFQRRIKPVAADAAKMDAWFDWLKNVMLNDMIAEDDEGFRPEEFQYRIALKHDVPDLEEASLIMQLSANSERVLKMVTKGMRMPAFEWPLTMADGRLVIQAFTYGLLREEIADGKSLFRTEPNVMEVASYVNKPKSDPTPEITKRLATRPIFGWLKEALGRGVVSYEDLKELLKQPLFYSLAHKEETYVSFFRKLDKFLEQEFPVMDKSRALFNLRFSNTVETMYGLLTIGYHSQRHDADVKRNTLNVLCPLSWGNDADWPVIVDPEVSFQPMHYTGTLADHAATEVRFHLQRTMNRVNFDMPIADQLQEYLQDPALVKIIDRRLIEANIHHLVRRVIVSVELPTTFVQSTPTVLRATANFYQNAHPQDPVVSPFVTLALQMDYEEPAFVWNHTVPDFEIIPKAAIEAVVQSEAHAKKFDLKAEAGFQTLTDPVMYSKLAAAPEHNPMHEVKVVEPIATDRGFDVKIDLDFTDPTVADPVFFMFEQVMPGIGAKYRELTVLLGQRAGLTGQEEVHLCVEGHVNDKLPGASRLDITLTHEETLSAGTIRTQVHYAFGA